MKPMREIALPKQPQHDPEPNPAALRDMLGANLRKLTARSESVSALCREIGINRTQFNRYLAGESFPRPDLLHRICRHFDVDARILLEPLENISAPRRGPLVHPAVADFLGRSAQPVSEADFPSGFYRFVRRSFLDSNRFVMGLIYVFRADGLCFLRGFEAREAMRSQGLPTDLATREFRGAVLPQDDGIAALVSRRGSTTATFNFLSRVPTFENNYWVGYTSRPLRENVAGRRFERQVYEHLGRKTGKVLAAARGAGLVSAESLMPYHRALLEPDKPIS